MADASPPLAPTPQRSPQPTLGGVLLRGIHGDRLLLSAFVLCGLLIGYQLTVTLLQPPWIKPATDWLRTALAWPQMLVLAWLAVRLLRARQPGAVAWCFAALGMLSYAVARTMWSIADVYIYRHGVPFPSLPDLFFMLQYPCFVVALFLAPQRGRWLPGVRILMDGVLWMSAITALSWYFVLLPTSLQTGAPLLSKGISMGYQIGDLVLIYGLVLVLARPHRTIRDQLVASLLSLAVASLFVADTWATVLLLHPPHTYRTGSAPDLFWLMFYLLVPLATVVRLRVTPAEPPSPPMVPTELAHQRALPAGLQFILPSMAVVAASVVIIVNAAMVSPSTSGLSLPEWVAIALLILATIRPAVLFIEQEQLRREREEAQARERALRETNQRMEQFLSVASHELKTPLTSLIGNYELIARRLEAMLRLDGSREDYAHGAMSLRTLVERSHHSLWRVRRLVEDLIDESRFRLGRLELRLEPSDLSTVVAEAVADQVALNPTRQIRWVAEAYPVPILADASRVEQVVTNYLSNALKFSREDQTVEVRLRTGDGMARVSVHDQGIGVPVAEQPYIWDRFHQVEGAQVQSGSQVGLGIGLYICKSIVERHHGQVGMESAPDGGTTFWFTLPLASSSPEAGLSAPASIPVRSEQEQQRDR